MSRNVTTLEEALPPLKDTVVAGVRSPILETIRELIAYGVGGYRAALTEVEEASRTGTTEALHRAS